MQQANRDGLGPNWRISDQKNLGTDSGCNVVENVDLLTIDLTIIFCLYNPVVDHDVIFGEDLSQLGLKLPHWVIKASICPCEPEDGQLGGLLQSSEELSCMGVANEIYGLGLLQPNCWRSQARVCKVHFGIEAIGFKAWQVLISLWINPLREVRASSLWYCLSRATCGRICHSFIRIRRTLKVRYS